MKTGRLKKLTGILFLLLLLAGCKKDTDSSWNSEWYGPITKGTIGLSNIVEDSLTYADGQDKIFLTYSEKIYSLKTDSFFTIPENIGQTSFKIPFNLDVAPGTEFLNVSNEKKINADKAEFTEAVFSKGKIRLKTKSTFEVPVEVNYEFPCITKNGQPLIISATVPAAQGGTQIFTQSYQINDYTVDLTGKNNDKFNKIYYNITAKTADNADSTTVTPADSFALHSTFKELNIKEIYGYFGQKSVNIHDTSRVDIFENIHSGLIELDSISANIKIENGLGADLGIKIRNISSINKNNGQVVDLTADFMNKQININRAVMHNPASNTIQPANKTLHLDNSNTREFMENLPNQLTYNMDIKLNPLGNISMGNDFYHQQYPLNIFFNFQMPLKTKAQDLLLKEETNIKIDKSEKTFNSGVLNAEFINYFPYDVEIKLYIRTKDSSKTYELTTKNNLISGAIPNPQGIVNKPQKSVITININPEEYKILKETEKLYIEASLETTTTDKVQIYQSYKIDYKIKGNIILHING